MNIKAYTSVGCFATTLSCKQDPFNEIVDSATCARMAKKTSTLCYTSCAAAGVFIGSNSMAIEMCVHACTSQGYKYSGINLYLI